LHAHVPADEADHGDDRRLPEQRARLGAVGQPQPRRAVHGHSGHRRLHGGEPADGGRQQPRAERAQHGHREHREAGLAREGARGEGEAGRVGTAPALDGARAGGDEQGAVHGGTPGRAAVRQGYEDGHHHRGAADEHPGNGRLRRAFGGEHAQVEADHADRREHAEPHPPAGAEAAQGSQAPSPDQRQQQKAGESVAQELTAPVRVVAEDAVGGEGTPDEDTGQGGEQGSADAGDIHGTDRRNCTGPA